MLQFTTSTDLNIILENLLFLAVTTSILVFVGREWRNSKPFSIPQPRPRWYKTWSRIVLVVGVALPLLALILWAGWFSHKSVVQVLIPYFVMLGFQILSEIVALRRFKSCVWVLIPCIYLPYRIWQLLTGAMLIGFESGLVGVQRLLYLETVLWVFNYGVHLSQIPRFLRWEREPQSNFFQEEDDLVPEDE